MKKALSIFHILPNPGTIGCRYRDIGPHPAATGTAKLVAIVRGYVVLQYPNCIPFVVSKEELRKFWEPVPTRAKP